MSSDTLILAATVVFWTAFYLYLAWRVGKIAHRRGRNVYTRYAIGFFSPIPAMILVLVLPNRASNLRVVAQQF